MSRTRQGLAAGIAILGLLSTAVAVPTLLGGAAPPAPRPSVEGDLPAGIGSYVDLRRTIPGNGGESSEGPGGAAAEEFAQRAYPLSDIPVSFLNRAKSDFGSVQRRGQYDGREWERLGPTRALYQDTPFRVGSYVPNEYVASGRATAIAISPSCTTTRCVLYVGAAGGGIWKTQRALSSDPDWEFMSRQFQINSIGALTLDPSDRSGNTIWVGTGEANACGVCVNGVGLYRSSDGGRTWQGPFGGAQFRSRGIGTIAVDPSDPDTLYVGSTRAVGGASSVTGGAVSIIPGAPKWGLYKSTDGGQTWTFVHNGSANATQCTGDATEATNGTPCSPRGVRSVVLDPSDHNTIYAGSYSRGVWRSTDAGATWTQIKTQLIGGQGNPDTTSRPNLAVTTLLNGKTRLYVGEGTAGAVFSRLFRTDDARAATPKFVDLTSSNPAHDEYGSFAYCDPQCWYDNVVYTPPGHPDIVYIGGSMQYSEIGNISNGRTLVLSMDAGETWTDMTEDAIDPRQPNGLHPDQQDFVVNPNNPFQFFSASDGGIVRSNGKFADTSGRCDSRGLSGVVLHRCEFLNSRVPERLTSLNEGLRTLQFMSLSVNPRDPRNLQGGTQDNGTFETTGSRRTWPQTIWGDGGQSGFDAADDSFRVHTYFNASPEVNFNNGEIADWIVTYGPIFNVEPQAFYVPLITDPVVSKTMYIGLSSAWRTKTAGLGSRTVEQAIAECSAHFPAVPANCGDWQRLGPTALTNAAFGDRAGGTVAAVERTASDSSTLWAATSTGRLFISASADAEPASAVSFTRIDTLAANDPQRFISSIHIDPNNPNHAWVSYSGYNASTPTTPGHVFEVTYDPVAGTATWTSLDGTGTGAIGDLPVTDLVRDHETGDLYASTDFGVLYDRAGGGINWRDAAEGMPNVMVAGLTIDVDRRLLWAASHGQGAWRVDLR